MSKLVVDTIQRPGGATLSFPVADGTAGQFLKSDASGNLTFSDTYVFPSPTLPILAQEGKGIVGCVSSFTDRNNTYSSPQWSSSGPWTTYTNYNAHDDNNLIQFINMALGDGLPQGTSEWFIGDDESIVFFYHQTPARLRVLYTYSQKTQTGLYDHCSCKIIGSNNHYGSNAVG